jgi:hypothetical protein
MVFGGPAGIRTLDQRIMSPQIASGLCSPQTVQRHQTRAGLPGIGGPSGSIRKPKNHSDERVSKFRSSLH